MEFGSFTISPQLQVDLEPKSSVKTTLEGVCLSGHLSDHLSIIHGVILGFLGKTLGNFLTIANRFSRVFVHPQTSFHCQRNCRNLQSSAGCCSVADNLETWLFSAGKSIRDAYMRCKQARHQLMRVFLAYIYIYIEREKQWGILCKKKVSSKKMVKHIVLIVKKSTVCILYTHTASTWHGNPSIFDVWNRYSALQTFSSATLFRSDRTLIAIVAQDPILMDRDTTCGCVCGFATEIPSGPGGGTPKSNVHMILQQMVIWNWW